jgi:hypothetical protein
MVKKLTSTIAAVIVAVSLAGCQIGGAFVAPTAHEKKVPAEYNLASTKQKVMIFIDEARSATTGFNYRQTFYDALSSALTRKARVNAANIMTYKNPANESPGSLSQLMPAEIGKKAGADLVLYVRIERFQLTEMDSRGFYSGTMHTQSAIFDTNTSQAVWPADGKPRLTRVNIDLEKDGRDKTTYVLADAAAHCITRHFYDCPTDRFRSGYEQTEYKLNEY